MIVDLVETFDGRETSQKDKGGLKLGATTEFTRTFRAWSNKLNEDENVVRTAWAMSWPSWPTPLGIPNLYDAYVDPSGIVITSALCNSIVVRQDASTGFKWDATCRYSTDTLSWNLNPLLRPTKIRFATSKFQRPAERSKDVFDAFWNWLAPGEPILNSAGDPFDPNTLMVDDSRIICTMLKNQSAYPLAIMTQYKDAINSDTWFGQDPYSVKVETITAEEKEQNGVDYWEVSYEFQFKSELFFLRPLDKGFRSATKGVLRDPNTGHPYPVAQLLNGSGEPLPLSGYSDGATDVAVAGGGTGTGYNPGDVVTLAGGSFTTRATVLVTAATAGAITAAVVLNLGNYTAVPANPVSQQSTTGTGTGATFTVTWSPVIPVNPVYLTFNPYNTLPFAALGVP